MFDRPTVCGLPLPDGMIVKLSENDKEADEVFNALIDYAYNQVKLRMLLYGEPFGVAFANYLEELESEGAPTS